MRTFKEVTRTQKETAGVLLFSLTIVLYLGASWTLPNIRVENMVREPMFYFGVVVFGLMGFLALEIYVALSFLGDGAKFGALGFITALIIGGWIGDRYTVMFLSGTIVGITLFYLKSVFAIFRILGIETRSEDSTLTVTEESPVGELNHFIIKGVGANFELLLHILEEFRGEARLMFYMRYNAQEFKRVDRVLGDTMRFYSNHVLPLHKITTRKMRRVIKQMCFEGTTPEILERGLINYWLRAHLNGGYMCILVPYESDFLEKAAACERTRGGKLDIKRIMNGSEWLMRSDSIRDNVESVHELYTYWEIEEMVNKIQRIHPCKINNR